jgi:hypothetical protein
MKYALHLLSAALVTAGGTVAEACSIKAIEPILFDPKSAQIRTDQAEKVRASILFLQSVDPRCVTLEADIEVPNIRLGVMRSEAMKRFLTDSGFVGERISIGVRIVDRVSPYPWARLGWSWANGRIRCDPASKRSTPTPMCMLDFEACYLELPDGTVCNVYGAANPNPAKYSVDPSGRKIE